MNPTHTHTVICRQIHTYAHAYLCIVQNVCTFTEHFIHLFAFILYTHALTHTFSNAYTCMPLYKQLLPGLLKSLNESISSLDQLSVAD